MTTLQQKAAALAPLTDELGEIEAELAPIRAKIKRAEALKSLIRASYKTESPAGSYQIHGAKWSALLGPMGNETVVDNGLLLEKIGSGPFAGLASVTLKAITEHCSPEVAAAVVSTQMSGSRGLSLVPAVPGKKRAKS